MTSLPPFGRGPGPDARRPGLEAAALLLPDLWQDDTAANRRPEPMLTRLLIGLGALVVALIATAAVVPIGGAVLASGEVAAESRVHHVAHPNGGVIAALLVHNGDHVRAGQVLLRLDDRVSGTDAALSTLTVTQLTAQAARLAAEQAGLARVAFPLALSTRSDSEARTAMAEEEHLFALRQAEQAGLRAQLNARVGQYAQEISGLEAQISALDAQRRLIEPERQGVRELWDRQLVTINRLNQLERSAADIDGQIGALRAHIAEARARISETAAQSLQLVQTRRVDAGTQLAQVQAELNQSQVRAAGASDQAGRAEIRAEAAGTIEKLAFTAPGDVVRPAEPILDIVPTQDTMVVEASIQPGDIDRVRAGETAHVRFVSFNRATTPEIAGRVTYVATDRTDNPTTHAAWYVVRIAFDPGALAQEHLALRSGMPAEVHIDTGSRALLSYLVKPLGDQFARAFRDH